MKRTVLVAAVILAGCGQSSTDKASIARLQRENQQLKDQVRRDGLIINAVGGVDRQTIEIYQRENGKFKEELYEKRHR